MLGASSTQGQASLELQLRQKVLEGEPDSDSIGRLLIIPHAKVIPVFFGLHTGSLLSWMLSN